MSKSLAREPRRALQAVDPSSDEYRETPATALGLALEKIRVLAKVISYEGTDHPAIVADCILDEVRIAEAAQQAAARAEGLARDRADGDP